jgi:hypothetical protein
MLSIDSLFIKIARMISPAFLVDLYRFIYGFRGDYKNWSDAAKDSVGYDSDIILSKVLDSSLKVIKGEAAHERDSVTFERIQYSWPLLAGLPDGHLTCSLLAATTMPARGTGPRQGGAL